MTLEEIEAEKILKMKELLQKGNAAMPKRGSVVVKVKGPSNSFL